ncbi:pilus assembly protein TadG-related protein [Paraburkholderia silviterrae]|uniref:Flp pilus-assembly TadG-like N-terminal domain-containing protein n=1 Tax=Paraburkholderia silviterrae TaxID=2528715 RepID=A0A4R5LYA2_9BURK|nr:pilus assembly protein TadG-related protein [Paraburkholderia silviterrae]TDG17235.1 hypothetical protein EYW47_38485 [Paraburkholderia silviterrae]
MIRYPARGRSKRGQRGVVAIQVGVFLVVLLSVAALTIDVARWAIVRNELQNAADAAALAGARQLPGSLVGTANSATWGTATTSATTAANTYAGDNYASGQSITTPQTVLVGYWDVNAANQGTSLPSSLPTTIGSPTDKPAVMVTVNLNPTSGAGMPTLLGRMLGVSSLHASATAVAIISAPGTAAPGSLFPMAMSQCVFSANSPYWSGGSPVSSQEISIGAGAVTTATCPNTAGQWTTFSSTINSANGAAALMDSGNSSSLSIGQNTYMQPGTESSVYGNQYPTAAIPPITVTLPVVADSAVNVKGYTSVAGFARFTIDYVVDANGKCVTGVGSNGKVKLTNCNPPITCTLGNGGDCIIGHIVSGDAGSTTAGGLTTSYFGAVTPPTLANLPSSEWY